MMIPAPDPGIYFNVPNEVYHSWDACSNSRLSKLIDSPAHCQDAILFPQKSTPALDFGSAFDTFLLQPDIFPQQFVVATDCVERVKSTGKKCDKQGRYLKRGGWYCGTHAKAEEDENTKQIVPFLDCAKDRYESATEHLTAMRDSFMKDPDARVILEAVSDAQVSAVWTEQFGEVCSVKCKLRADILSDSIGIVVDVKTTDNASYLTWQRDVEKYGYHRQGGMYLRGLKTLGREYSGFVHLAIEKSPPHVCGVYALSDESLEWGWVEAGKAMLRYNECQATNHWPGYGVRTVGISKWAMERIRDG